TAGVNGLHVHAGVPPPVVRGARRSAGGLAGLLSCARGLIGSALLHVSSVQWCPRHPPLPTTSCLEDAREAGSFSRFACLFRRTNMDSTQPFVKPVNTIYCASVLGQSQDVGCVEIVPAYPARDRAAGGRRAFRRPPVVHRQVRW